MSRKKFTKEDLEKWKLYCERMHERTNEDIERKVMESLLRILKSSENAAGLDNVHLVNKSRKKRAIIKKTTEIEYNCSIERKRTEIRFLGILFFKSVCLKRPSSNLLNTVVQD